MPYKDYEDQKAYHKEWYKRNKDKIRAKARKTNKKYKDRNMDYVRQIKSNNPCSDCGGFYHYSAMDFDHITEDKDKNVARMVRDSISIEKIQREIDKCELVCSNCHRLRTWRRLQD